MVSKQDLRPKWVQKLEQEVRAKRNVVIIYNNVEDDLIYLGNHMSVKDVVTDTLNKKGSVTFDLGSFGFSDDETELAFRRITGLPVLPEDPGPMPDTEDIEVQQEYMEKYSAWVEWKEQVEVGKAFGRTPVQCLPAIPVDDPLIVTMLLDRFASTIPVAGALRPDGVPYDDPRDYALVVDYASFVVPDSDKASSNAPQRKLEVMLTKWSQAGEGGVQVVLYAPSLRDVSKSLYGRGSLVGTVEVSYPDFNERYQYLKFLVKEMSVKLNGCTLDEMASVSAGLSNRHLKAIVTERVSVNQQLNTPAIRSMQQDILAEELTGTVELVVPDHGFETIGGLEAVKAELEFVAQYIEAGKYPLVPMGMLFVGPPGTGKTYVAEAFAHRVGFNFIRPGQIKSKWVGESERNIAKLFEVAKALAPVVIFWDEVDQESNRDTEGDAGVSRHIFGALLRFMSDTSNRGKILTIAASNRPDLIDPAMKRPGRFDVRIPLLYPDEGERAAIFDVMFLKYDLMPHKNINVEALAKMTEDYSGADIECVVLEAARIAERRDLYPTVGMAELVEAINDYILHWQRKDIEEMELLAVKECNSIRLLPESYRKKALAAREQEGAVFEYEEE